MAFDARTSNLLSVPQKELPDGPPSLPDGHYLGQVMKYEMGPTPWNSESESLFYHCQITGVGEDVTEESVAGINLLEFPLRPIAYEILPDRIWAIKALHKTMGLDQELTTDANIPEAVGKPVLMFIQSKPGKSGDGRIFSNIVSMVGVPS
jgi:hypothetical protein